MKKTFVLMIAVFAFAMVFTSCTKEGQYMPSKKISEIVFSKTYKSPLGTEISRTEREVWNWNGKLLSYIDYYDATGDRSTTLFRYDDDQRIEEINYGSYTAEFDYEDGLIEEIQITNEYGDLVVKYAFEHKGKTVTAIDINSNGSKSLEQLPFNPLKVIIPENAAKRALQGAATKGSSRMVLTWTGKNVTGLDIIGSTKASYKWDYDDKINPFKGLYDVEQSRCDLIYSENNVTREEMTDATAVVVENYSYTYDSKYPVLKEWDAQESDPAGLVTLTIHCVNQYKYQ